MTLEKSAVTKIVFTIVLSAISANMVAISQAQESDVEFDQARQEIRELKREHKRQQRELRRNHRAEKMLVGVDTNKDGQVDLNEYLAHAEERFNKLDADSNGLLSVEEAKESMKKLRAEHREKRELMRQKRGEESR